MLFKPFLVHKIIAGQKTQTRRIERIDEAADYWDSEIVAVYNEKSGRVRFALGKEYAVQPGRGQCGVWWHPTRPDDGWCDESHPPIGAPLRIRITAIHCEDVRNISEEDARAEGFASRGEFLETWCQINDPAVLKKKVMWISNGQPSLGTGFLFLEAHAKERPGRFYSAWALTFEVVK